jgi:hypothetical protein
MENSVSKYIFFLIVLTFSFSNSATEILTEEAMIEAAFIIDEATKSKDIDNATKFYRPDTVFYQHQTVNGEKTTTSQTFKQSESQLKVMFKFKQMKLKTSVLLSKEAKLHNGEQGTLRTKYKRIYDYKGEETESIETYIRIFEVKKNELTISEEHRL